MSPVFVCSLCGAEHPATERDDAPVADPETTAKLRLAWLKFEERDKGSDEGAVKRAEQATRASIAYFGAAYRTGSWLLPVTITTGSKLLPGVTTSIGKPVSAFYFKCVTC